LLFQVLERLAHKQLMDISSFSPNESYCNFESF
jgi:hypothetical protein